MEIRPVQADFVSEAWQPTVSVFEAILAQEQFERVEEKQEVTRTPLERGGQWIYRESGNGNSLATADDTDARTLSFRATELADQLVLVIIDSWRVEDPIAFTVPLVQRISSNAGNEHLSFVAKRFREHVISVVKSRGKKDGDGSEIQKAPQFQKASVPGFEERKECPQDPAVIHWPRLQPTVEPQSDLDPLGGFSMNPLDPARGKPQGVFRPDGNLIGPSHPDFGPRNPFTDDPQQRLPECPRGIPRPRYFAFDPVGGSGDPDPDHQPVPNSGREWGGATGSFPRSFM